MQAHELLNNLCEGIKIFILSQLSWFKVDYKKRYGKWAVISGSTDGIGLAMARELARRGHSIVVMGKNEQKLAKTKASLLDEPNVGEVETVCCDLSDVSQTNIAQLRAKLDPDNRDIGILINNAGVTSLFGIPFHDRDSLEMQNAINIGIIMYVQLTRMVLPGMLKRKRGLIVNVSSVLSLGTIGLTGLYSIIKIFVDAFSKQLAVELANEPVDVVNLNPGLVKTKLAEYSSDLSSILTYIPPETYAKSAVNAFAAAPKSTTGCIDHVPTYYSISWVDYFGLSYYLMKLSLNLFARKTELESINKSS